MARPFGSVQELPSGRFRVEWSEPGTGRRRSGPHTFATRGEARTYLAVVQADYARNVFFDPKPGRVTVEAYSVRWLADKPRLAPGTVGLYQRLLRLHIVPSLGPVRLGDLSRAAVRSWHAELVREASPSVAPKAYRLLRGILETALSDGLVTTNPVNIPSAGKESADERPTIGAEQVVALARAMPQHLYALTLLLGFVGLRVGEALGLERRHVNLLRSMVRVEQQRHIDGSIGPPKSKAGTRTLPLPATVRDALAELLLTTPDNGPQGLVFVGVKGGALRRGSFYDDFHRASVIAGVIEGFRPHDLRHSAATLAAQNRATLKELMAMLGHSTADAALRYQHAAESRMVELAAHTDTMIREALNTASG